MLFFKKRKQPNINYSIKEPLFNESILETNFYEELQKNEWCKVIGDQPDNLFEIISISIRKSRKI